MNSNLSSIGASAPSNNSPFDHAAILEQNQGEPSGPSNLRKVESLSNPPGTTAQKALLAKLSTLPKPSQYQHWTVSVTEIDTPSHPLNFGADLEGNTISCQPLKAYQGEIKPPSPGAGKEKEGKFYLVDSATFVKARDRALTAQAAHGSDVVSKTAEELDKMGAKLYLNATGGGGIGTRKIADDGRTEAINGFNVPFGHEVRSDLEVTRRSVMKLDVVSVAVCKDGLVPERLKVGYMPVATVPHEDNRLRVSLVQIPHPEISAPSPETLDREPVLCATEDEFQAEGVKAYKEIYNISDK